MSTAGDLIALLRPQLNDSVTPYRHADADFRRWLNDGQRLIVQLKPEANPATARFAPAVGSARQRLDMADAHTLIRVEQNYSYVQTYIAEPGWSFTLPRHKNNSEDLLNEYEFVSISSVSSFPINSVIDLPNSWTTAPRPALIITFAIDSLNAISGLGVTYDGDAMTVVSETRSFVGDDLTTKYITLGLAIIALDPANPPATDNITFSGTGAYTTYYAQYGVFSNIDVVDTVAGFATQVENSTPANGYSVAAGPVAVANGDMVLTMLWVDWTNIISNTPIRANEIWSPITPPAYTTNYAFFAVSNGDADITVGADTRIAYGLNLLSHVESPTTTFSDTWHYAFQSLLDFPVDDRPSVPAGAIGASFLPGYSRMLRIVAEQNAQIEGPIEEAYGTIIRSADRDVYDTFDPDWMSRAPDPVPAYDEYFDGFCFDPDDPLGFFLHPKPTRVGDQVMVTYAAVPAELVDNNAVLAVSDMYVDPLCNYVMYRALSAQTQGYSAAGAARAIERFGQQLNLSRETILGLIGDSHRQVEQQQ